MSENEDKEEKDKLTQLPVVRKLLIAPLGACTSSSRASVFQWHLSRESKGTFIR
jgi:hypothetical protein